MTIRFVSTRARGAAIVVGIVAAGIGRRETGAAGTDDHFGPAACEERNEDGVVPAGSKDTVIVRDAYPATAAHPRYSEGSIIVLRDETLLFAITEFSEGSGDDAASRILARASSDGGTTWGEPRVLQENIGRQNVMSVTLRRLDPAQPSSGPIGMFFLVKNSPSDLKVHLRVSEDEARTFGPLVCVTDRPGYHVMNNDRVTVLANGRIICPVSWSPDWQRVNRFVAQCFFSDDGGKTWQAGSTQVELPKRGAMEPEVIELTGGRLLMILRTQLGCIGAAYSDDRGDTWGEPDTLGVAAPEAPATIRRIPSTGDLLLVWNHTFMPGADHGGPRTPLTLALSRDEGRSWRHFRNLEDRRDQGFAYASVAFLQDRVLLSYWVQEKQRISARFRSVPIRALYASGGGDLIGGD